MAAKKRRSSGSGSLKARKQENKQQQMLIFGGIVLVLGGLIYFLNQPEDVDSLPAVVSTRSAQQAPNSGDAGAPAASDQQAASTQTPASQQATAPAVQQTTSQSGNSAQTNFRPKRVRIQIQGIPPEQAEGMVKTQDIVRGVFAMFGREKGLLSLVASRYSPPPALEQPLAVEELGGTVEKSFLKLTATSAGKQKTGWGLVLSNRDVLVPSVLLFGSDQLTAADPLTGAPVDLVEGKTFGTMKEWVLLQSAAPLANYTPVRLATAPVGNQQYRLSLNREERFEAEELKEDWTQSDSSARESSSWLKQTLDPQNQLELQFCYGLGLPVLDEAGNVIGLHSLCYAMSPSAASITSAERIIKNVKGLARKLPQPMTELMLAVTEEYQELNDHAEFLCTNETMTEQGKLRLGKLRQCEFQIFSEDQSLLQVSNLISGTESIMGRELARTEINFDLRPAKHIAPLVEKSQQGPPPVITFEPAPDRYVSEPGNGLSLPTFDTAPSAPPEHDTFGLIWSLEPDSRDPDSVDLIATMAVIDRDLGVGTVGGALLWSRTQKVATLTREQLASGQLPQAIGTSLTQMTNKFRSVYSRAVKRTH